MMTTSAGTVRPAKVVVMGSGVAGLQAIATAKRLGAVVYASDVRKSAAEQIESVGGRFIEVDGMDDFEDNGYAKPLTPEFIQKSMIRFVALLKMRHRNYYGKNLWKTSTNNCSK